jgi:transposase
MIYVGVDISSEKFDVAFYYPQKDKYVVQTFRQSKNGFKKFSSKLNNIHDDVSIAMESTGIYDHSLLEYLRDSGFNVVLLHPYAVKNFLRARSHSKTDTIDAKNLAFALFKLGDDAVVSTTIPDELLSLRKLVRFRASLVKEYSNLQKQLRSVLKLNMPEILNFFSRVDSIVLVELLCRFPSRKSILEHKNEVIQFLSSFKRWSEDKAKSLVLQLESSIGLTDSFDTDSTIISTLVNNLKILKDSIKDIDKQIEKIFSSFPHNPISTIPGMGNITQATVISEIGDIQKFPTKEKFVSFLGLDPVIRQSGKSFHYGGISKKGNTFLRRLFYNFAVRALRFIPKYRLKYDEMKKRGKHPKVILTAIARKLAELVYAIWKKGVDFDPSMP